jgi:aminodeoxyfutalosine deaminase
MSSGIEAFVRAMPKVELHVHLVGSVRNRGARPSCCTLESFAGFASAYCARSRTLRTGADLEEATVALARAVAESRVRYAEVTLTPLSQLQVGIEPDELGESLARGGRRALEESGVHLAWVFDISGDLGPRAGVETVRWVERHAPPGTVGETTGPASVRSALDNLHAERIGHGIRSVDDAELLRRLAAERVALEVCPTSNVCTGAVAEPAAHPLPSLLEAGVPVTLATDNPAIFGIDLNDEYLLAHAVLGLSRDELLAIAATDVEAAFCPLTLRRELAAELQRFAAAARPG